MSHTFFITCPWGAELVARADIASMLEMYKSFDGAPFYSLPPVEKCQPIFFGPPLSLSESLYDASGRGKKNPRGGCVPRGGGEAASECSDAIKDLHFDRLLSGTVADERAGRFRGVLPLFFRDLDEALHSNNKEITTPLHLVINHLYFIRSISDILVSFCEKDVCTSGGFSVPYAPAQPLTTQTPLASYIQNLFLDGDRLWRKVYNIIAKGRTYVLPKDNAHSLHHNGSLLPPLEGPPSVCLFRASAVRMEKTHNVVAESPSTDVALRSVDLERHIGELFDDYLTAPNRGVPGAVAYRASMLYYHVNIVALHDHDQLVMGIPIGDAYPPRLSADTTGAGTGDYDRPIRAKLLPLLEERNRRRKLCMAHLLEGDGSGTQTHTPKELASFPRPATFKHDFRMRRGPNSMSPAIASVLAFYALSRPEVPEDLAPLVVCDPFAGTGTTLLECQLRHGASVPMHLIGGDVHSSEVRAIRDNAQHLAAQSADLGIPLVSSAATIAALQWDAVRLPLRRASVDVIVSDLPFGRRCGNAKLNNTLYEDFLCEAWRVLRAACDSANSGRLVVLSMERRLVTAALAKMAHAAPFDVLQQPFCIDMGGITPYVFVLRKMNK